MKTFSKKSPATHCGFTLVELLVVISIIAVLAGFTLPVLSAVKARQYKNVAQAELKQIEGALENYKAKYGVYPPGNGLTPTDPMLTPLYYELLGTTRSANGLTYTNLDNSGIVSSTALSAIFGVGGVINSTKGGGEDVIPAKSFLPSLNANRIGSYTGSGYTVNVLITSAKGPDASYMPLNTQDVNPFRYLYPGTNNPSSYDLWVDLVIKGKTNRISNW